VIWGWSGSLADRDDVIDIFDVVFGDMQRAATNRGKKRLVSLDGCVDHKYVDIARLGQVLKVVEGDSSAMPSSTSPRIRTASR